MKKVLSLILALALCLSAIPFAVTAFAADTDTEYIYFGSYPQSKVEDYWIEGELNALAPDWDDWTSYGYYSGTGNLDSMLQGDWMRYVDVTFNAEKYRGVKFTQYRPIDVLLPGTSSTSMQDNYGYNADTVYWFKYEPLKWRILDKDTGLVMCETLIDAQPFSNTLYSINNIRYSDAAGQNYGNNYVTSSIRAWLTNDFYNTAFSTSEKSAISKTTLNNDSRYTLLGYTGFEQFDGEDTEDYVFLLSHDQALNSNYGFKSDALSDSAKVAYGSDYAICQGLLLDSSNRSAWFLRTSSENSGLQICSIDCDGKYSHMNAVSSLKGVRPAMTLNIFDGGSGTETDPYQIKTLGQLEAFRGSVNAGNSYEGKYITLTSNIDLSERYGYEKENWTPIGVFKPRTNNTDAEGARPFKGTFDGNGYAITGLFIKCYEDSYSMDHQALFAYNSDGGVIENLTVYGDVIAQNNCAGIVSNNYGTVKNCINNVNVGGFRYIAGIAVQNQGTISGCINNGYINSDEGYAAGICAFTTGGKIEKCYNTGLISSMSMVGGIVGYHSSTTVKNCYNTGDVYALGGTGGGGISGYRASNYDSVSSIFNIGTIGYGNAGGIVGAFDMGMVDYNLPFGGTNAYYLEDCYDKDEYVDTTLNSYGTAMTAEAFKDGTVTALLQGDQTEQIWKQGKEHPELALDYSKMSTKITFDVDGVTKTEYINGNAFDALNDPTKDGFTFGGWYTDKDCTDGNEFTFGEGGCSDITIYAKWIENAKPVEPTEPTKPTTPTQERSLANLIVDVIYEFVMALIKIIFK